MSEEPLILRVHSDGTVEVLGPDVAAYLAAAPVLGVIPGREQGPAAFPSPPPWARRTTPVAPTPQRAPVPRPPAARAAPVRQQEPDLEPSSFEDEEIGELEMADPAPREVVASYFQGGPPPAPAAPARRAETPEERELRLRKYRRPIPARPGTAIDNGIEL